MLKRVDRPRRSEVQRRAVATLALSAVAPAEDAPVPRQREHMEVPRRDGVHSKVV